MALSVYLLCSIAIIVQGITCQGIRNLNAGSNNGLPFGSNFANGLVGSGYMGPNLGGPGLVGNGLINPGLIGSSLGCPGLGGPGLASSGRASGGAFAVTSSSPISPTGVSILAENLAIEGPLTVGGQLPFVATIGLQGALPATGSGTVSYGCGTGNIGITSDIGSPYGLTGQYGSAAGQYGPGTGQHGPVISQYGAGQGGQYGPPAGQYVPATSQYGAGLGGPSFGTGIPSFTPGFGASYGAGVGPGFIGNGMAGGIAANLAQG